jgi:large subunit ribosomal protein L10
VNVNRAKKEQTVKEMNEDFKKFDSFFLLDFNKMSVAQSVLLRRQLRENQYSFRVIKNRLALLALKEDHPEDLKQHFRGATAIAFASENPIGLARALKEFAAEYKILSVKGGLVEGQYLEKEKFSEIANLTSRNDLLAKLGYLMASPLTKLLRTWQAPVTSLGSMLSQLKSKK